MVTATEFFTEHVVSCIFCICVVSVMVFVTFLLTFFPCFLEDDTTPSTYPANEWNVVFGPRVKQGYADPCTTTPNDADINPHPPGCIDATIHRGKRKLCVL